MYASPLDDDEAPLDSGDNILDAEPHEAVQLNLGSDDKVNNSTGSTALGAH